MVARVNADNCTSNKSSDEQEATQLNSIDETGKSGDGSQQAGQDEEVKEETGCSVKPISSQENTDCDSSTYQENEGTSPGLEEESAPLLDSCCSTRTESSCDPIKDSSEPTPDTPNDKKSMQQSESFGEQVDVGVQEPPVGGVEQIFSNFEVHEEIVFEEPRTISVSERILSFFRDGTRRKASSSDIEAWIKLSLTLDGRDKLTKVLQYVARFLAWSLQGTFKNQAKRLDALKSSLSNGRKAFRLGRTLMEVQTLRTMGLLERLRMHWKQISLESDMDWTSNGNTSSCRQQSPLLRNHGTSRSSLMRRLSTNIGLDYESNLDLVRKVLRQQSFVIEQIRRMPSRIYEMSFLEQDDTSLPLWQMCLAAVKLVSMSCYYLGDNFSFLSASGVLDDFSAKQEKRISKRRELTNWASIVANRADFVSGVVGLILSWRTYREFCQEEQDMNEDDEAAQQRRREKHFGLVLSLIKNSCDLLTFTNHAGVDIWRQSVGFPLNEGIYCIAGFASALSVLCAKFPMHEG